MNLYLYIFVFLRDNENVFKTNNIILIVFFFGGTFPYMYLLCLIRKINITTSNCILLYKIMPQNQIICESFSKIS